MKVLLVEDSRAVAAYVEGLLDAEPDIELLPTVTDGAAAPRAVEEGAPDLVLMDLELPGLNGVQAIEAIMARAPRPVVVLSSHLEASDRDRTFESLEAGAVEVMAKPRGLGREEVAAFRRRLVATVRLMAEARVVNRRGRLRGRVRCPEAALGAALPPASGWSVLLIGASTGGPPVLHDLLRAVPAPLPCPVVIAQHVIPGFEPGVASWLAGTGHPVRLAEAGEVLSRGVVLLSRADRHLTLAQDGAVAYELPEARGPVPAVDRLFTSAAATLGARAAALLLTGMGTDGAAGMLSLRQAGAVTVTQRADSCVIDGMPGAARRAGASRWDLGPDEMAAWLGRAVRAAPSGSPGARSAAR